MNHTDVRDCSKQNISQEQAIHIATIFDILAELYESEPVCAR